MHATEVQEIARRMFASQGIKAIAEAAQNAVALERQGDKDQARNWRRIEAALQQMGGPRQG